MEFLVPLWEFYIATLWDFYITIHILSKLLQEKYADMFEADIDNSTVIFSENLVSEMLKNNENGILISEVKMNAKE